MGSAQIVGHYNSFRHTISGQKDYLWLKIEFRWVRVFSHHADRIKVSHKMASIKMLIGASNDGFWADELQSIWPASS